ncbi:MAG: protein kinase domain-containing protein, partial [Thermoanaerobaculia bacterium]
MDSNAVGGSRRARKGRELELALALGSYVDALAEETGSAAEALRGRGPEVSRLLAGELLTIEELEAGFDDRPPFAAAGRCLLLREIGSGAMGVVYEARQVNLDRRVAVKLLPASLASERKAVARFLREARVTASLDHPHVVRVHDAGIERGVPYLVMELVEGETLR